MKIFEFALETEQMAKDFFEELAHEAVPTGPRKIFSMLAAEEQQIAEKLWAMRQEFAGRDEDSTSLDEAADAISSIFLEHCPAQPPQTDLEAYRLAVDVERAVLAVFRKIHDREPNRERRELLAKVVAQEAQHCTELEDIYYFVAEPKMSMWGPEASRGEA